MDDYFKFDIEQEINKLDKTDRVNLGFLKKWQDLQTDDLENYLLTILFPPIFDDLETTLKIYQAELLNLRGLNEEVRFWFTADEINKIHFDLETLSSINTTASLLASLRIWHLDNYVEPAKALLYQFEKYTNGAFVFDDLDDELALLYIRITLLLLFHYFADMPLVFQSYLLNSDFFHLGVQLNLNFDYVLRQAINSMDLISDRRDLSLVFATFIYENDSPVGVKKDASDIGTNAYWIDLFRQYSKKKFDGMSLINFFNASEYWENCILEDKMIIKQVLVLYSHLILGNYVIPSITDEEREQVIKEIELEKKGVNSPVSKKIAPDYKKIKQDIESHFSKDKNGDYKDIEGIMDLLEKISKEQNDEKIAELFYWDEADNKFKWMI